MLLRCQRLYHANCPEGMDYQNPMAAALAVSQGWQPFPLEVPEPEQVMEVQTLPEKAPAPPKARKKVKASGRSRKPLKEK